MKIASIKSVTKRYSKNLEDLSYEQKRELYYEIIKKIWIKDDKIRISVIFPDIKNNEEPSNNPQYIKDNLKNVYGGR